MRNISEKDWKKMKGMKDAVLNIACERILKKVKKIIKNKESSHAAYVELWDTIRSEDEEIGIMFDDLKRSNAKMKLAAWRRNNLVSDEDFKEFSEETQQYVNLLIEIQR